MADANEQQGASPVGHNEDVGAGHMLGLLHNHLQSLCNFPLHQSSFSVACCCSASCAAAAHLCCLAAARATKVAGAEAITEANEKTNLHCWPAGASLWCAWC